MRSKEQLREIAGIKQRVLDHPASANVDDGSGTPLDVAVINNYLELAEWLFEHHADVNARDGKGETALHRIYPSPGVCLRYVQKGAEIFVRNLLWVSLCR